MGLKALARQAFHDRYPALITSRAEPTERLKELRRRGEVKHTGDLVVIDEEAVRAAHAAELLEAAAFEDDQRTVGDQLKAQMQKSLQPLLGSRMDTVLLEDVRAQVESVARSFDPKAEVTIAVAQDGTLNVSMQLPKTVEMQTLTVEFDGPGPSDEELQEIIDGAG